jgi:membrane-bound lytic murein transglycosylase MltF
VQKPKRRRLSALSRLPPMQASPTPSEKADMVTETEKSSESVSENLSECSSEHLWIRKSKPRVENSKTRQSGRVPKPSKRLQDNEEDRVVLEQMQSTKKRKTVENSVEKERKNKARKKLNLLLDPESKD